MSTTITPTEQNIDINVTNDVIDINVTNEIVDVNATTQQIDINVAGAYPIPNPVLSVFGRTGVVVATEGDYTLTQLGDVTLSSPSNGQVLKYNGTAWVNGLDAGGITTLNTLTALSQYFATGTSGSDFNISSATATHTFNLPTASATNRGALSSADWTTFNNKQNALTNPITGTGTSGQVAYFNGTSSLTSESNLFWDAINDRLGIGGTPGAFTLDVNGTAKVGTSLTILSPNALQNLVISHDNSDVYLTASASTSSIRANKSIRPTTNNSITLGSFNLIWSQVYARQFLPTIGSATGVPYAFTDGSGNTIQSGMFGGANFLAFSVVGTEAARFADTSRNLLINTTTDAGFRLDVNGTARVQGNMILNTMNLGIGTGSTTNQNMAFGFQAGSGANTGTGGNMFLGYQVGRVNTSGSYNVGLGYVTLFSNTTGIQNTAIGTDVLYFNTTGSNNTAIGTNAGTFISGGVSPATIVNNSIFIGYQAYPLASSQTNQIVIGYDVVGLGSNTTSIGNASTVTTAIYGDLLIGTTTALASTKFTLGGSETASGAIARGGLINTTLVAAANNDVLVGLDINPTFTNGAFTGVTNAGFRMQSGVALFNTTSQIATGYTLQVVGAGGGSALFLNSARTQALNINLTTAGETRIYGDYFGAGADQKLILGTFAGRASQLVLQTTGNVGINTSTDAGFRLDVNGTARVQSTMQVATTLTVQRNQSVGDVTLSLDNSGGVSNWRGSIAYRTESGGGNQRMVFNSQGSDVISIFGSGGRTVMGQSHTLSDFVSSAVLNLVSTTYGFLPPRMTTTQKNAIVTPAPGLMVYDTTLNKLAVYTGAAWETVTSL
jgi:hypothetical protein